MADKFNSQFTPDTIDEQIDQHLASQSGEQSTTLADRTIKTLQQHYISMQDHSQSLERVWSRFTDQRSSLETIQQGTDSRQSDIARDLSNKQSRYVPLKISSAYRPLRRSGLIAAVIFLALTVGGMVALPQLLYRSNQSTLQTNSGAATPTALAIVREESISNVLPADGGNAYLYKGINLIKLGQAQALFSPLQFKAHSGKLVEVNSQKGGARIWSYTGDLLSSPLLTNDVLYVPSQTGLDALRASDHTLLWHQNLLLIPYQVSNGMLYAFGQNAGLEALRASDGALLWRSQYKLGWIDNNIVYATESFDYINALRPSDGMLLWRSQLVDSDVYIENGAVFLHTASHGIRALNGKTGALLWSNEHISNVFGVQNGVVYGLAKDGVVALRADNGQALWRYEAATIDGIFVDKDIVYIDAAQNGAHPFALHPGDGKLLWQSKTSGQMRLLQDGVLYLDRAGQGDPAAFLALKASDGSLLWQRDDVDHFYSSPPQNQNGIVYVMLIDNKTILALKASNGATLARYSTDTL